jgi:ketosteroid isomerase-like protein
MSYLSSISLGLLILATPQLVVAQAADSVQALDARWAAAYATHDTAYALAAMSPAFVMTSTSGRVKDRAAELHDVRVAPGLTVNYFRSADVQVRMHDAVAIVTGQLEWSTTSAGGTSEMRRRYTATWVRGGPLGWQLVALHVGQSP